MDDEPPDDDGPAARRVTLREERHTLDQRFLWAWLDDAGALHLEGQDLGPSAGTVTGDDEYEYDRTIEAQHLPAARETLGIGAGEDLLTALEERWSGDDSYELERRLSVALFPIELRVW